MMVALSLFIGTYQGRGFTDVQICDPMHRVSWNVAGKKSSVYGFPKEMDTLVEAFAGALQKGFGSGTPAKSYPVPNYRAIVVTLPWKFDNAPSVKFVFGNGQASPSSFVLLAEGPRKRWVAGCDLPTFEYLDSAPVTIGIADARWRTAGSWNVKTGEMSGARFSPHFILARDLKGKPMSTKERAVVEATAPLAIDKDDWRIVGFDRAGNQISGAGSWKPLGRTTRIRQWMFGPQSSIARVELQTRPFKWTPLGNVPFQPK